MNFSFLKKKFKNYDFWGNIFDIKVILLSQYWNNGDF